ncbi:GAF domain-containing protein [Deltaproteobacteria bacterium IMCC39524]|nr:GAF domain-containing protein [Deltaproteobacteria bacterium IMCC39524]
MVKGADVETCWRLLLLETAPGSLDEARLAWPAAESFKRTLDETQGVADQISRDKIQIVFSDLSGKDCSALNVLSQIRRVHPHLPLVAILPEEDFSLGLSAFRVGADDVLVRPLDKEALIACRENLQSREQAEAQFARTQQEANRSLDDLILLKAIGETTSSTEDLQKLLDRVVDLIQGALDVEIVSLMLVDEENILTIRSACGLPDDMRHKVMIAPGEGVSGHVLLYGEAVLIDDLSTDGRFPPRDGVVRYRTGSLLSVPIQYQQRIVGVLNVNNKRNREAFTGIDQELLQTIAHQAALAIENMKLVGHLHGKNAELEQAHESLMRLHQDRTRFVCNLSHELKTPLTSVLGFSDLLLNYFDQIETPKLREYIASIYSEGKHLEHLLTGLLRLFSLDSGSENWDWQVASLPEALSRVLENHDVRIQEMNLNLHVDFPEDLQSVWADQDKLELLFDALVDNAVKFNRQGGRLSVTAGNLTLHGEPTVYVQISNQGKTVPRENAEDIFQEYSQLGELDTGKPSGIGVGLATCRAILRQMKGDIFLEPNDEEGTSIGLLLPTRMELNNG